MTAPLATDAANTADTPLTSLLTAAGQGDVATVVAILDTHTNLINERGTLPGNTGARTALHFGSGHEAVVRALLERGADPNDAGATLTLPAAIALERPDDVERLIREDPDALSATNNRRWARLLVRAGAHASGAVVDSLLRTIMRHRSGLSIVNMQDDEDTAIDGTSGYTALHAAAFRGNDEVVAVLLKHGANPRTRDRKHCATPAGWAAYAGHHGTAALIVDADIDLFDAITFDRADRVGDILDRDPGAIDRPFKAYASCKTREGQWWPAPDCTPIEWATSQGKAHALGVLVERTAGVPTPDEVGRRERVASFLESACWDHQVHGRRSHRMHDRAAQRLLAHDPSLARDNLYTAIVCGDLEEVTRILTALPEAARRRGGDRNWTPILYLAYTRFSHIPTVEHALAIAMLLLDHGADPNDFYMAGDARYSVLSGVAGEGEQDSPRQPYAAELFDLLLERGADPFDIQVLYNTHFSGDILWWLELVYEHTIRTSRGAAWQDADWGMFDMGAYGSGARFLLETAVKTRREPLAKWCLAHGANPNAASARDPRFPRRSLYEFAMMEGLPGVAEQLAHHGASRTAPVLNDEERFLAACFRLDREEARAMVLARPAFLESPEAMFTAAKRDRPDVLTLLLDLGCSVDIQDRTGKRALHEAAVNNASAAAAFLVERGAEIDPRESSYDATPIGWAAHGDRTEMVTWLSRHSHDLWTLCFSGCVDRVAEILKDEPNLARAVSSGGHTLLWWLPDDDQQAMRLVDLLLAAGANPLARSTSGSTAASWARRRGMLDVATRLEQAAAAR